jgi:hypothetical protein
MDLKDLWIDEREKVIAFLTDHGLTEGEAEDVAALAGDLVSDAVADRYAAQVDAARDRMKYEGRS